MPTKEKTVHGWPQLRVHFPPAKPRNSFPDESKLKKEPSIQTAKLDFFLPTALALILLSYALLFINFHSVPAEDASILMRYAEHLGEGHGITWNVGEKPVDGATDFLFMVVVGAVTRAGLSVVSAARVVGSLAHVLTVFLIYFGVRKLFGGNPWMAFVSAAYLAVGPGFRYVEACFGTTVFALAACAAWCFAESLILSPGSPGAAWGFGAASLLLGLIRPEGAIFSAFMLVGVLYALRGSHAKNLLSSYLVMVGLVGGAYFLWRWHYFGHPLPNPFYRKGGGHLYPANLVRSVRSSMGLALPFIPVFVLGLFSSAPVRRKTLTVLVPVAGFAAIWLLMNNEMDFLVRYQYALVPLVLLTWPSILQAVWQEWHLPMLSALHGTARTRAALLALIIGVAAIAYSYRRYCGLGASGDGNYNIALKLRKFRDRGFTMAVTEAGNLPLHSRWRAVDAWGLNDSQIALRGGVTDEDLTQYDPQLIMFHWNPDPTIPAAWKQMVAVMTTYAKDHHYVLAAAFGCTQDDLMVYYVRPDFAESHEIIESIRDADFPTPLSMGMRCHALDLASANHASIEDTFPQALASSHPGR